MVSVLHKKAINESLKSSKTALFDELGVELAAEKIARDRIRMKKSKKKGGRKDNDVTKSDGELSDPSNDVSDIFKKYGADPRRDRVASLANKPHRSSIPVTNDAKTKIAETNSKLNGKPPKHSTITGQDAAHDAANRHTKRTCIQKEPQINGNVSSPGDIGNVPTGHPKSNDTSAQATAHDAANRHSNNTCIQQEPQTNGSVSSPVSYTHLTLPTKA